MEGIADEGGRKEAAGKAKGVRKGEVHCGEKRERETERKRKGMKMRTNDRKEEEEGAAAAPLYIRAK